MTASIAWKPTGDINLPSSRLRAYLPCLHLQKKGFPCEIFNNENISNYSAVIFQKAYTELDIDLVYRLKEQGIKTVFDLCDNHFYVPVKNTFFTERSERLQKMVEAVDWVTVSTPELAKLIKNKNCTIIDDLIEAPKLKTFPSIYYKVRNIFQKFDSSYKIVWFGSAGMEQPAFGMIDLKNVISHLENLNSKFKISLTVISSSKELFKEYFKNVSFKTYYHPWKRESFPYLFKQHDVCIIPVNTNPFTVCKTNNRLTLSLLLKIPVVADRIPSYEEFSPFVLFSDWEKNLQAYKENKALRQSHIDKGISYIEGKFNMDAIVIQWEHFLKDLLKK